ncbi:MAG: carbohydrate kinase [Proteobacteria bacterium]|nr:carbohydrate kinase [Verrucomicrobiota bacterium]NBU08718.1 carbohydrate kinase [Pseudomonadota bacterium]
MTPARFTEITSRYASLRLALVGDFCLDRYLEIDPARAETSIETGLPVHNVVRVRSQPGGAGTILNNLSALGVGVIHPVGFCGEDGEGYELQRALALVPGVQGNLLVTPLRRTFTYCKPLVVAPGRPPVELNRLDNKNWTPTPALIEGMMVSALEVRARELEAVVVLDQVDVPETGVVTQRVLSALGELRRQRPELPIVGDSRCGLRGWPPIIFKMNAAELSALTGLPADAGLRQINEAALALAKQNGSEVFITLSERGILGAAPNGEVEHVPCHPLRGPLDIVGAGDSVTANLTVALAAGATLREAIELANAAASIVIHQLGTTGTASVTQIRELLVP